MDANDDFYGKGLNELLLHAYNFGQKYPKPTIVVRRGLPEKKKLRRFGNPRLESNLHV